MSPVGASSAEPNRRDAALVIGNFDGVHRGHQALVAYTRSLAEEHGLRLVVMTFEPHPAMALGGSPPPLLTTTERKLELLRRLSPDMDVLVQRFDREFAELTPREFVARILVRDVHVRQLVVGANFHFGHDRQGSVSTLRAFGREFGFDMHAFELSGDDRGSFSSSRIRRLIVDGELAAANELLGRPHALSGVVVTGDGRGRTLGFPTANLDGVVEVKPRAGVYACRVDLLETAATRSLGAGVVHLGPRPTVERDETIEVHLIDGAMDLYGKRLRVGFLARLRDSERFSDIDALKRQIARDVDAARQAGNIADGAQ
jgi:riboflavin kinase / FMN adenylyltransferase